MKPRPVRTPPHVTIASTDRTQSLPGRRGHQLAIGPNMGTIVNNNTITTTQATAYYSFPVTPPPNAVGYIAFVFMSSNTADLTSSISLLFHNDVGNSLRGTAVGGAALQMDTGQSIASGQVFAPIVKGRAVIEMRVAGSSPSVGVTVYLVGWVLA